jgi:hypothetical protein
VIQAPGGRVPVGISSCLFAENVCSDGGHEYDTGINTCLHELFEFIAFCLEVAIGPGIPHEPIQADRIRDREATTLCPVSPTGAAACSSALRCTAKYKCHGGPEKVRKQSVRDTGLGQARSGQARTATLVMCPQSSNGR